jgi:hypothetical protein
MRNPCLSLLTLMSATYLTSCGIVTIEDKCLIDPSNCPGGLINGSSGSSGGGSGSGIPVIPTLTLSNGQAASVVIGEPDFITRTGGTAQNLFSFFYAPSIAITSSGVLYVMDNSNNRIMGFNSIPITSGANADFVVGQSSWSGTTSGANAALNDPLAGTTDSSSGNFFLAEDVNKRILIYNTPPTGSGFVTSAPNLAIGASSTTVAGAGGCTQTGVIPVDVFTASGKIAAADYGSNHNRVLLYNSIPTSNNQPADVVLGQPDFTTCTATATATGLNGPVGVWADGTRIVVADSTNNRVLIWNTWPTSNGQAANIVLGQANMTANSANAGGSAAANTLNVPYHVESNGTQLFVADLANNRVLVWNTFPTQNQQAADGVIGQPNFTTTAALNPPTSASLNNPYGVKIHGTKMLVSDGNNARVLVYVSQ